MFKKIFPISRLPHSYSTGWGQETKKAIDSYKDSVKTDIKQWIMTTFKLKNKSLESSFFIDEFKIFGNPTSENELKQWIKNNKNWLNDYYFGYPQFYEKRNFYTLYSSNTIIGLEPYNRDINGVITGKSIDDDILSRVIVKSIHSVLDKHTIKIEDIKAKVFKYIYQRFNNNYDFIR